MENKLIVYKLIELFGGSRMADFKKKQDCIDYLTKILDELATQR